MATYEKKIWLDQFAGLQKALERYLLEPALDRALVGCPTKTQRAVKRGAARADANNDSYIYGPKEGSDLWKAIEQMDRDGVPGTISDQGCGSGSPAGLLGFIGDNLVEPDPKNLVRMRQTGLQEAAQRMRWYKQLVLDEAKAHGFAPEVIFGLIYQESQGRRDRKGGPNKDGSYDYGLMQINDKANAHRSWARQLRSRWQDPAFNISKGLEILDEKRDILASKVRAERALGAKPRIPEDQLLRAALAAYNSGEGNVWSAAHSGEMEQRTYTKDFASRVLLWARYFKEVHPELLK